MTDDDTAKLETAEETLERIVGELEDTAFSAELRASGITFEQYRTNPPATGCGVQLVTRRGLQVD